MKGPEEEDWGGPHNEMQAIVDHLERMHGDEAFELFGGDEDFDDLVDDGE